MSLTKTAEAPFSRGALEFLFTAGAAFLVASIYNKNPIFISIATISLAVASYFFLTMPEYGAFFIAALLPFRDINLVSVIHLKRAVIWTLFIYVIIRTLTERTTQPSRYSRNLLMFGASAGSFALVLLLSYFNSYLQAFSNEHFSTFSPTSIFFSIVMAVIEELFLVGIAYALLTSLRQLARLIDVILVISAMIALLGIVQYYRGGAMGMLHVLFDPNYPFYGRATSVFSGPNIFAEYLAPTVGIALASFLWGINSNIKRFGFILPILLVNCWGVYLSSSREGMLQVLASLCVMGYIYYVKICAKTLSWKAVFFTCILVGIVWSAYVHYEFYIGVRLKSSDPVEYQNKIIALKNMNNYIRKHAAMKAVDAFRSHPVFGIGFGMFSARGLAELQKISPHNEYLRMLAETGLLGFLPFICMIGVVLKTGLAFWNPRRARALPMEAQLMMLFVLTGAMTVLCSYFFSDPLPVFSTTGYFCIYAGAIFALEREYRLAPISAPERERSAS